MRYKRPLECPACGYERIANVKEEIRTETGTLRVRSNRWACRLCRYTWHTAAPPRAEEDWLAVPYERA